MLMWRGDTLLKLISTSTSTWTQLKLAKRSKPTKQTLWVHLTKLG